MDTMQIIDLLKQSKPDLSDRPFSRVLIEKYYDQLITDSVYISQTLIEAQNKTSNTDELLRYLVNDYISIAVDFEYTNVKTEMKQPIKLK